MTNREKVLLKILFFVVITIGFVLTFQNFISEIKESKQNIIRYSEMRQKLKDKTNVIIGSETNEDIDLPFEKKSISEITDLILNDLKKVGIIPLRYQISEDSKGEFIELSISCDNIRLAKYIRQFKDGIYPYTITVFNLKTETEKVNATIRYTLIPSKIINYIDIENSVSIESLFRPIYTKSVVQTKPVIEVVKEENIEYKKDYNYIGRIKDIDGSEYMYFKNAHTNKVIKVAPENVVAEDEEKYLINMENNKFYIRKGE